MATCSSKKRPAMSAVNNKITITTDDEQSVKKMKKVDSDDDDDETSWGWDCGGASALCIGSFETPKSARHHYYRCPCRLRQVSNSDDEDDEAPRDPVASIATYRRTKIMEDSDGDGWKRRWNCKHNGPQCAGPFQGFHDAKSHYGECFWRNRHA